jgi:hypothetical protein
MMRLGHLCAIALHYRSKVLRSQTLGPERTLGAQRSPSKECMH